jgi:biotin carboxylase
MKNHVLSFADDAFDNVEELPAEGEDPARLAPFLPGYAAVVAAGEYSVIFAERLSHALGLFHNPLGRVQAYRDKHAMREAFRAEGVSQPRLLARFTSMDEVQAFDWSALAFPVIVKPVDMSSSFYVRLCNDAESAKKVYRRIFKHAQSFSGAAFSAHGLLEEAVSGPEYSVECVVQEGQVLGHFLTAKFLSPPPACDEIGHLSGEALDSPALLQVHAAVLGIVRAWQVRSAVMHIEFKVCGDTVKVIEGACRIGGDMISSLVELRYGVSLEECALLLRLGRDVRPALHAPHEGDGFAYGIRYLFADNLHDELPAGIEVLQAHRLAKPPSAPGAGLGVEHRLGHQLLRSRSLPALRRCIGALSSAGTDALQGA